MARLNDPPVPVTESIDALKRRFIRQNREIARVNSTQSQRIRNLETEISRLLAENINLREQAIAANAEAEKWKVSSRLGRDVRDMKSRLESKLLEVSALVEELSNLPDKAVRRSSVDVRRKSGMLHRQRSNPQDSPEQRDWRNGHRQSLTNGLNGLDQQGQDGRLPAILEDKYYPRRTFENDELRILTALANATEQQPQEDTESPEIGPPPIAHFDVADSIAFDSSRSPKRLSGGGRGGNEENDYFSALNKNLETRRKRRTSSLLQEMSTLEDETVESSKEDVSGPGVQSKPISKRKFEASALDNEPVITSQTLQNDGFEFSRKELSTATTRPKPTRFAPRAIDRGEDTKADKQILSPQKKVIPRSVLAPKSTNSPTKKSATDTYGKQDTVKIEESQSLKATTRKNSILAPIRTTRIEPSQIENQILDSSIPPKTPAPTLGDVISPPSSALDTEPKMKSTEAAFTTSVEDVLSGSMGRGPRRARAAVSYAEPNLRDKMRRPDKKLVGAVEGIVKASAVTDRDSIQELPQDEGNGPSSQPVNKMRIIRIKSEKKLGDDEEEDKKWKELPPAEAEGKDEVASPLQDKKKSITSDAVDRRRKRTFSESEGTKSNRVRTSTAQRGGDSTDVKDEELDKAVSRLSIFDPPTSSPILDSKHDEIETRNSTRSHGLGYYHDASSPSSHRPTTISSLTAPNSTSSSTTTKSRRHSVQPQPQPQGHTSTFRTGKENNNTLRTSTTISTTTSKLARSNSVQNLNSSRSAATRTTTTAAAATAEATSTGGSGGLERTLGARRRSMMV